MRQLDIEKLLAATTKEFHIHSGGTRHLVKMPFVSARDLCLSGADFLETSFDGAFLFNVDFSGAMLAKATFRGTRLWNCNFTNADMRVSDLSGADIRACCFNGANMYGAMLYGAKCDGDALIDANNADYALSTLYPFPEVGSFHGFVKTNGTGVHNEITPVIAELEVPDSARRIGIWQGCRCSEAKVVRVLDKSGKQLDGWRIAKSINHGDFCMEVGDMFLGDNVGISLSAQQAFGRQRVGKGEE